MNCPMHHKIFGSKGRSYRDLPIRLAEYGTCYRYEKSGELFGLMRVRSMQMNDAHIYVSEDQFEQEFLAVIYLYLKYFELFGIEKYVMRFSKHSKAGLGKKYVDNERLWLKTEDMVRRAMINGTCPMLRLKMARLWREDRCQIWSVIDKFSPLRIKWTLPNLPADLKFTNKEGREMPPASLRLAHAGAWSVPASALCR
jgi:threonyl-tRNA synthetase